MSPVYVGSGSGVLGTTVTEAALVARLRRKFLPAEPWQDTLSSSQTSGATTIQLTNVTAWGKSDIIEAAADGEQQRILPFAGTIANPVTVERAHGGTTAVAHSSGDTVYKDPRFPYAMILDAIDEIVTGESWPYLYAVATQTITPVAGQVLYSITDSAFRRPISATQQSVGSITDIFRLPGIPVERDLATSISTTGMAYKFNVMDNLTNVITVTYQAHLTSSTIPEGAVAECVLLGAAAKVMRAKAVTLSSLDTRPKESKATIQELLLQADVWERKFHQEKQRAQVVMDVQYGEPQADYGRSLVNFVTW